VSGAIDGQNRNAPIFTAAPIGSYGAAQLAVQAILASLLERKRSGSGCIVRTSLVQGLAAFLMRQEMPRGDHRGTDAAGATVTPVMQRGIELCFMTAECRDGRFLQMCARQDKHFRDWLSALGLGEVLEDARFSRGPLGIPKLGDVEELEGLIRAKMRQRTADQWMRVFTEEFDVGADPFLTFDEFLDHPQMIENRKILEIDDPTVGRCVQVGPIAAFADLPDVHPDPAPLLGQHNALRAAPEADALTVAAESLPTEGISPVGGGARRPATSSVAQRAPAPPLSGITVIEVCYYIAGPLAGTLLAELGARVIKVEPLDGDPYRRTGLQAAKFLHGKESIALDLKRPEATRIMHQLVQSADVFVHSFRPGVPERLGIDYQQLNAINEGLVYVSAASYGSKGPQSRRAAFHSTPNALVGSGILQAGVGNPPVDDSYPDPGSALAVATAALLGLHARDRNGRGDEIETTMLASAGYIMSPYLVRYPGRDPQPIPDERQHGFNAQYRLYPCAEGWVFVAVTDENGWRALGSALDCGGLLTDPAFADRDARMKNDDLLRARLEEALAARPAGEWEERSREVDAPLVAVTMEPIEEWLLHRNLLIESEHPKIGTYWRPPVKVEFDRMPARVAPAASVGEHTFEILAGLGYSAEEAAALVAGGVAAAEP
jgi:crotonobetainyl-CoA:carnitine CoA-transferase CaiB-like acyl-CoA transferase